MRGHVLREMAFGGELLVALVAAVQVPARVQFLVLLERAHVAEGLPARRARVALLALVHGPVVLQAGVVAEGFPALVTPVVLFSRVCDFVAFERLLYPEAHAADGAGEGPLRVVRGPVVRQLLLGGELLIALIAAEQVFARVELLVEEEGVFMEKQFPTELTRESVSGVDPHVLEQLVFGVEGFLAQFAAVRVPGLVELLVLLQSSLQLEHLLALVAGEEALLAVDRHVEGELLPRGELLLALVAGVKVLARVEPLVLLQGVFVAEGFPALITAMLFISVCFLRFKDKVGVLHFDYFETCGSREAQRRVHCEFTGASEGCNL